VPSPSRNRPTAYLFLEALIAACPYRPHTGANGDSIQFAELPKTRNGPTAGRREQHLIKTAPRWTILRMNYYVEALAMEAGMAAQSGALVGLAENRVAFVVRDDVAAAAAGILLGEDHAGAIYNATESKAYTGAERAVVMSEVFGKPVGFTTVPVEAFRGGMTQMGLPTEVVDAVISIQNDFAAGAFDIVTGDVEKLSDRPPKPLREALAAALQASRS
jgi:NAD(P)H dehydrogenase (quinone)